MNVGDTVKCNDAAEMIEFMYELARAGVETDFMYEKDGNKGFWLIVTGVED